MSVTNWDDRDGDDEIKSTDIDGLQDAAGKMESIVGIQTEEVTGGSLAEEFCDATDRYRLYASAKKNWLASPEPNIYVNSVEVTTGFTINYGGGCIEFDPPLDSDDVVTADFTCTKAEAMNVIPYVATTGSANTYTATLSPAPTAYYEGMAVALKINVDNTGASTINLNSLGAKTIKRPNGSDVTAASLKANSVYTIRYNGTNFILQGEGGGGGDAGVGDVLVGKTFTNDSGEQTGTMPDSTLSTAITPSTIDQAITAGYHAGTGNDKVLGDADLISANIKSGITIFGVAGNSNVVDTSTGDATAAQILSGKKAWVDGAEVTGSMTNRAGDTSAVSSHASSTSIHVVPAGGYYDGSDDASVITDADFIASNIKSGVDIFGVTGTMKAVGSSFYEAGDVEGYNTTESEFGYGKYTTYTLKLHCHVGILGGTFRIIFKLKTANAATTAYGIIYRNGVAVGTERSTTSTSYVTYSEDISGWSDGDEIQIYMKGSNTTYNVYVAELDVTTGTTDIPFRGSWGASMYGGGGASVTVPRGYHTGEGIVY
jgi:hypothetical protein